jgi:hypothetical protein
MNYTMDIKTSKENNDNMKIVLEEWDLCPEKTSVNPKDNKECWSKLAKAWKITEIEARTRLCANCEYYNNTSDMMIQMNSIPLNKFDLDGGGRGYCHKFDFICHNLRTCKAWEEKDFYLKDEEYVSEPIRKKGLGI